MARRGENIRQRKDRRWEGRYIKGYDEEGKAKYRSVYAKSYNECKRKLLEAKSVNSLSDFQKEHYTSNTKFFDIVTVWLESIRVRVKHSTYVKYRNAAHNHILAELGGISLKAITANSINGFLLRKRETGRLDGRGGLSVSSIHTLYIVLTSVLAFATEEGLINFDTSKIKLPRQDIAEICVLSKADQLCLEDKLLENMDNSKLGLLLCLYSGLRLGEICALRWEDIDLEQGIIKVRNTAQRIQLFNDSTNRKTKLIIDIPKSKCSIRDIPINSFIRNIISTDFTRIKNGYLVTNSSSLMEPRTYQYRFKSYLRNAGLDGYHFHALRHTFATNCINAGVDAKSLSEFLGHANVNITLNRYVHTSLDMKQKQIDKLTFIRGQNCGMDFRKSA